MPLALQLCTLPYGSIITSWWYIYLFYCGLQAALATLPASPPLLRAAWARFNLPGKPSVVAWQLYYTFYLRGLWCHLDIWLS